MVGADWVGHEEAQLVEEVAVVSIAATAADEGLPVVVERLDASGRGAKLGEGEDAIMRLCSDRCSR